VIEPYYSVWSGAQTGDIPGSVRVIFDWVAGMWKDYTYLICGAGLKRKGRIKVSNARYPSLAHKHKAITFSKPPKELKEKRDLSYSRMLYTTETWRCKIDREVFQAYVSSHSSEGKYQLCMRQENESLTLTTLCYERE
jgi:hypothetical protein